MTPRPIANLRPAAIQRARQGFTLTEVLVLLGIVLVLISIFVPYASKLRESDRRIGCMKNLECVGSALQIYANTNQYAFPCTPSAAPQRPGYTAFTGPDAADPFAAGSAVARNDVTASLWLLVRQGYVVDASVFICPSTRDQTDPMLDAQGRLTDKLRRGNFRSPANLSYSYCSPYSAVPNFKVTDAREWYFAVVADKNPGVRGDSDVTAPSFDSPPLEIARANSNNHAHAGQNVLYPAGNVSFVRTPFAGVGNDNIYTAQSPTTLPATNPSIVRQRGVFGRQYGPASLWDSYLVPAEGDGQ